MPFDKGSSGNPSTQFQIGNEVGQGRPKGSKNRSTIARKVMDMAAKVPAAQMAKLKILFPELTADLTVEEVMTLSMAARVISKSDYNAYKALMDSGYGAPKQTFEGGMDINWHETKSYAPDEKADDGD